MKIRERKKIEVKKFVVLKVKREKGTKTSSRKGISNATFRCKIPLNR